LRTVVIVGWRSKAWKHPEPDDPCSVTVRDLIEEMQQSAMLDQVRVCSIGSDSGIGAVVKATCATYGVPFFEFKVWFQGGDQDSYISAYVARHASLIEVGDVFHIFVSDSRKSIIENLVERVKSSVHPYKLYGENGQVLEDRITRYEAVR